MTTLHSKKLYSIKYRLSKYTLNKRDTFRCIEKIRPTIERGCVYTADLALGDTHNFYHLINGQVALRDANV